MERFKRLAKKRFGAFQKAGEEKFGARFKRLAKKKLECFKRLAKKIFGAFQKAGEEKFGAFQKAGEGNLERFKRLAKKIFGAFQKLKTASSFSILDSHAAPASSADVCKMLCFADVW